MPSRDLSPRLRVLQMVRAAPGWDCINARQRKYARESGLAVSPSCLMSPPMHSSPRKRGTFRAQPGCPLERRTRRWRKTDSNSRSLRKRERPGGATPGKHWRLGPEPVSGSAFGAAVSDWQRPEEPFAGAGPKVRIHLPPAKSPRTLSSARPSSPVPVAKKPTG